jgi:outer membrane protein assembly factor BamB
MKLKFLLLISTVLYFILFSCSKSENIRPDVSKEITSFTLKKTDGSAFDAIDITVNIRNDSIIVYLPPFTDFSNLIPEFIIKAKSVSPASGVSQNFNTPVTYTVTAEDGSTKQYKASASVAQPSNIVYMGGGGNDKTFYALDANTGILKWSYVGGAGFIYSSPTYENGVIYVGCIDNFVYAFNAVNGKVLWKTSLCNTGIESDAVIVDGTVYVGTNEDEMVALNARTGAVKWRYLTGANVSSSPKIANGVIYFGSSDGALYALQTAIGQLIWKYQTGAMINQSGASLVNGILYFGSQDNYLYAINAQNGSLVWRYNTGVSLEQSSPTVVNGVVYIGGWYNVPAFTIKGSVYAINATTGMLVWEKLMNTGFSTSPFVNNNRLFICGDDGNISVLNATTGATLWQKTILANSASPVEVNGIVYVGGGGTRYFYALDANIGSEKWKFPMPNSLMISSPLVIINPSEPNYSGDSGALD